VSRRPPLHYEIVGAPSHPLAKKGGYIYKHEEVLYARIGAGPHPCHWCGQLVNWKQTKRRKMVGVLCTDHLNGVETDNRDSNLVPSCFRCNISRAHPQNFGPADDWVTRGQQRLRYHIRTCVGCGQEFKAANFIKTSKDHAGRYCSIGCYQKSILIPSGELFIVRKDGVRQRAVELCCPNCSASFVRVRSCLKRKGLKFCGKACAAAYYAKLKPREFFQRIRKNVMRPGGHARISTS
jgi:hypothetical protein